MFCLVFLRSSTSITHVCVCDAPVPRVSLSKDLGVFFDPSLSFKEHTDYVNNKANKSLGYICRMSTEIRDLFCLKSLYCCWVRSILEYACVIWSPVQVSLLQREGSRGVLRGSYFVGRWVITLFRFLLMAIDALY